MEPGRKPPDDLEDSIRVKLSKQGLEWVSKGKLPIACLGICGSLGIVVWALVRILQLWIGQ